MGLTMKEKQALAREISMRYRKAGKKGKTAILDEFVQNTGYNRKYALHLLANWGRTELVRLAGRVVKLKADAFKKRKAGGGRKPVYQAATIKALKLIWEFFDYMCGKRLSPFLREQMPFLNPCKEFGITKEVKAQLLAISPATIDRKLKPERKKLELKGRSATRPGGLLKHQIPIRVFYAWDERKPGFFELDTVVHDGGNASGEFCCTLNATDVYSGWVELRALLNKAHRWVKEEVSLFPSQFPFPLLGIDSDNGGEFINYQLKAWCDEHRVQFTRSRSYHKNDNCFVEQKNDMTVRRTVGYYRYDTLQARDALAEVYRHLCPLLNYFYPSEKIIAKERIGARVKKVYDKPKSPYRRLLESPDLPDIFKNELRRRAARLNPVKQKRLVNHALMALFELQSQKSLAASALEDI
ncbi:integrase catalytic domain-containing protein [Leadbettera azotonutricia]|uniref:Integrase domain protein n=1 Tax=Leadbettera azotonutricia (strain ATCC BAA-888 / DSM 13862 / ZAS-9) TaxID=545695 RepID=F5Y7J4_LEAAZ|nr:DDE-type integrase/transposase/recombinase [Leadbettera azotonutricia]AEF82758.1 integrase domain protein [Leadbettera azotonutricia ZAS-9]